MGSPTGADWVDHQPRLPLGGEHVLGVEVGQEYHFSLGRGGERAKERNALPDMAGVEVGNRIDASGTFTLRYRSKLHHVSVGREHKCKRVLILMANLDVRVIDDDGVVIRHLELDPSVNYQGRSRIIF